MTDGAQQALRRTMEIYSKTTRFALACNASDKIIGKSRMNLLSFVVTSGSFLLSSLYIFWNRTFVTIKLAFIQPTVGLHQV